MSASAPAPPLASAPPSIPRRIGARVIDYVVISAAGGAIGSAIGFGFTWLIATAALTLAYFVIADVATGTTIGKAVLGLRVESPTGGKPSLGNALGRELFVVFGAIPFVGPLLALIAWLALFLTIRKSPAGQGWHDRLAGGTRIVAKTQK